MDAFTIDGNSYPMVLVKSLKRQFQVLDGENAGRNMQGDMIRDVIGTYYNYSLELDCTYLGTDNYNDLYEVISAPKAYYTIKVPYGNSYYQFTAYITNGEDELYEFKTTIQKWRNLSFNFIAISPFRRPVK